MRNIITTKAQFTQVLNAIDKAINKILFKDWTEFTNSLEFE